MRGGSEKNRLNFKKSVRRFKIRFKKLLTKNRSKSTVYSLFTPWRVAWSLFLESPGIFWGRKNCFMFAVFAFKTIVSIILKMIQWNYQFTKQDWPVSELRTVVLFNSFWFENLSSGPKSYRAFLETGPWSLILLFKGHHDRKSENSRKIQSFTKNNK